MELLTLTDKEVSVASNVTSLPAVVWQTTWPRWWPQLARVAVLLLVDVAALLAAASLGYLVWARPVLDQPLSLYVGLIPLLCLFPLGYAGSGLYPGFGVGAVETLRRLSCCTSFAFLVLAAASFALKLPSHYSRMTFIITLGACLIFVPLLRFFVLSIVSRWQWWGEPVVLVGNGQWVQWTIRALGNALSLGYRPVGVLSPNFRQCGRAVEGVPVLGGTDLAPRLAERGVRVALVGENGKDNSALNWLQQFFQHVVILREYEDRPVERVRVCNLGGLFGIEFTNGLLRWQNRLLKRTLDVVFGFVLLFLTSPLIFLAGLLARLSSHGPIFFCQEREGLEGHSIKVWKLRTMYQDAELRLEEFLSANPELRREWERYFKLAHDPRIIPGIGVFLRRFSLDELPQFWSVVKGEMSLVGPRAFPEYHLKRFHPEFRELRRRVRPGLTGMWQMMVRSNGSIEEQRLYDTYYVRNWSIWLDLYILARTIFVVLAGRGAC